MLKKSFLGEVEGRLSNGNINNQVHFSWAEKKRIFLGYYECSQYEIIKTYNITNLLVKMFWMTCLIIPPQDTVIKKNQSPLEKRISIQRDDLVVSEIFFPMRFVDQYWCGHNPSHINYSLLKGRCVVRLSVGPVASTCPYLRHGS